MRLEQHKIKNVKSFNIIYIINDSMLIIFQLNKFNLFLNAVGYIGFISQGIRSGVHIKLYHQMNKIEEKYNVVMRRIM